MTLVPLNLDLYTYQHSGDYERLVPEREVFLDVAMREVDACLGIGIPGTDLSRRMETKVKPTSKDQTPEISTMSYELIFSVVHSVIFSEVKMKALLSSVLYDECRLVL